MRVLILEDNADRIEAMTLVLRAIDSQLDICIADNANDFVSNLAHRLGDCRLISLDHDLGPSRVFEGVRRDPGDGRDVAKELANHAPCCPVIIHSTNLAGAQSMGLTLRDAEWQAIQITPYGDLEWVQQSWMPAVKRCLSRTEERS